MNLRPLLALGFILVGCAATSTQPTLPTPTNTLIGIGSHGSPNEALLMQSMGARITRVTYFLHGADGASRDNAQARAEMLSRIVDLESHNLQVLIVVHDFDSDTVKRVLALAKAFPERTIQVGNEWDAAGYTGTQYASLMTRIVALNPTLHLAGMGLASTDGQSWSTQADTTRITQFTRDYRNANGPTLDSWCVHAYGLPLSRSIEQRVRAIRRAWATVPIWITETGTDRASAERVYGAMSLAKLDSLQTSEAKQAIAAAKQAGVARLYFYQLWDAADDGFGFVRADTQTTRPVANALQ